MEPLWTLLSAHGARHPRMEPCDAVKLVYQSVLGGGHLITDPAQSLERLAEEYAAVPQTAGPLYEALGNGVVRVHLSRLDAWGVGLEALNGWFVRSAAACPGTRKGLEAALEELIRAAEAGLLPFSPAALAEYLRGYRAAGCPPVSHSAAYRAAYHPAYRVGLRSLLPEELRACGI